MSVCDVPVIATVCQTVGSGAASLVAAPFDWLAQAMGQAAAWLFKAVWGVFDTTTLIDVTKPGYVGVYNILFGVAVFLFLIFFCLQLITGLIHRDPTALSRAALGLAKSVLGSFLIITLTALLLEVTDQLCQGIVQATGTTMAGMGDRIALLAAGLTTINIAAPGVGAIITIFLAGLAISAAAIVWFSLLIRKALLLVAVVLGPIALAGATWEATKGWFTKWATFVVALIFSKLVLVVIFLVAITQVSAPIQADLTSVADPISGVVLMAIAAFAPYLTYKFLSFVGIDMYHAISSEQEAKQALNRPIPIPTAAPGGSVQKILNGNTNNTSGSGGASPGGAGTPAQANGGSTPAAGKTATGGGGATASSATGGSGAGAAGGAGAAAGAAAGPIGAAVVAGATIVKGAATAGPKAGAAVGAAAEGHAAAAVEQALPPPVPPAQTTLPARSVPPSAPPAPITPASSAPQRSDPPPPSGTPSGKE